MFNMIAAVSQNGIIGINNGIPWRCKADMQHFKATTMGHVVVMGRKTYDSLFDFMKDKSGEPLPGRIKYVISIQPEKVVVRPNVIPISMFPPPTLVAENLMSRHVDKNIFVIGGAQTYKLFDGCYQDIYLTRINCNYTGERIDDVVHYLPITDSVLNRDYELLYKDSKPSDADNECSMTFEQWRLRNKF